MNRITTFQIPIAPDQLRPPVFAGDAPTPLAEPLQALMTAASRRAAETPFTVYLCADDDSARARDDFAIALARTLTANIPSTLVVDCDFLHPGLSGHVPQRDALGFLDYLLYGSSIGVITQDHDGVHIVGPGSFPVTKRMPFVETAFTDAARRLVAHARCVIFVGPAFDGDGGRHPITADVEVVATVRATARHPRLDSAEEHISGAGAEVWSVRLTDAAAAEPAPAPVPVPAGKSQPETEWAPSAAPAAPPARPAPATDALPPPGRVPSSLGPRIGVMVIGLLVVAFVAWWYLQNRDAPGLTEGEESHDAVVTAPDTSARAADTLAARDTAATTSTVQPVPPASPVVTERRPAPTDPAATGGRTGGTQLVNSEDIQLMEDLDQRYHGWFVIHISSFQTSVRAREEVAFLQSREFPAFSVFLDLGPKGKWYRVYAGPFQTRDEARDVKKNLDAIPQVRFTRIASIPD